jgi:hypothetical protein
MYDSEHAYNENFISESLKPLLSILNEEIYLDKNVVALQRAYEVKALEVIRAKANFDESVTDALTIGLIDQIVPFKPFFRLKLAIELTPTSTIYDELRRVQLAGKSCPNIELTIDQNFFQGHRYLDVLANFDKLTRKEIGDIYFKISDLVGLYLSYTVNKNGERFNLIRDTLNEKIKQIGGNEALIADVHKLWRNEMFPLFIDGLDRHVAPSYKAILYSVLKYVFQDKFNIDLEHINSSYKSFDFRIESYTTNSFNENFEQALEKNKSDVDRVHEIEVLRKQIRGLDGKENNYVYACIDRLLVLDITASPEKRKYTDLDGVILFVGKDESRLEIIEAKNTKNPIRDAKKDLNSKLIPALDSKRIKGYKIAPLKGKGAKLVIKF